MRKKVLKKIIIITALSIFLIPGKNSLAKTNNSIETEKNKEYTEIIIFVSPSCPHCSSEKNYLQELQNEYPQIAIKEYVFSENTLLINDLYEKYRVPKNLQGLVPATFIKESFFIGFNDEIKNDLKNKINGSLIIESEKLIKVPLLGKIDIEKLSLPVLAVVLGIVDGFNVCSLGALVIILGLVMVLRSRKKILLLGGLFLLVTGIVYGLLIFMWHQLFFFISPYVRSMELLIGLLSLIGGIYLLREYFKSLKGGASCESGGIIAKLSPKVEKIFSQKKNIIILSSVVIIFAAAITIIEFPCSALLPVLFASILVESDISLLSTIFYMIIFLFFYLLDELIIFLIALFTMKIKIVSPKFINIFNLVAALIFLFLGFFYLYRFF